MFPRMLALSLLPGLLHSVAHADLQATKIAEVEGFKIPECVVVDTKNQIAYVSNVNAAVEGEGYDRFWADDGNGFISKFTVPRAPQSGRRRGKAVGST